MDKFTDRDRLIELIKEAENSPEKTCPHYLEADCFDCPYDRGEDCDHAARKADYLLANGVIVPPCKVGDVVYTYGARRVKEWVITFCGKNSRGEYYFRAADEGFKNLLEFWGYEIGFKIFLTKEDAMKKLKELGKDEHF